MIKFIYLASPYSYNEGTDAEQKMMRDFRYLTITRVAACLIKKTRNAFFLPITQSHALKELDDSLGTNFESWEKIDLCAIDHSDEVWVVRMDGWKDSVGVKAEIKYAKKINKPIKYVNPMTLKVTKR